MNLLDLLLLIVIAVSIATGFRTGFARTGIGFIAVIAGILFGFWFYGIPAQWIHRHLSSATASNLLGFFLVFFACVLAGAVVANLFARLFKWTRLSWLDRLLGGVFGLVRGSLVAVALVAVLLAFAPNPTPTWIVDSKVLPYAIDASNLCSRLAPHAIKEAFRVTMGDLRKAWDEQLRKSRKKEPDLRKVES